MSKSMKCEGLAEVVTIRIERSDNPSFELWMKKCTFCRVV